MNDVDGEIARRAYRRYQERGGGEGRALDDWLAAESEVAEIENAEIEQTSSTPRPVAPAGSRKRR